MRICVQMLLSMRDGDTPARVLRQAVSMATLAEKAGFDGVWLSEHHDTPLNACTDTLTVLAAIGQSVSRLRLGAAIVNLPLHHPLAVAERAALVDNLSGGRLGYRADSV
jgi:alkanesulfonate monooxygenase SsuD/methylene tetrahydromethanopterin reductase-like flavin-dependent oxidoreductase (luciferase family)